MFVVWKFITNFATDINLMDIKLICISYEVLRQGRGVRHTPDELGADGRAGSDDGHYGQAACWQDYAADEECQ